ncbi:hypothetical protein TICRE_07350 [Tissierella creatinophila DSM 6911]|uniref:Uncharacterized protein n=1 Tax=Tissierella creatinophila DSM 6911 TaxID=1123403 RepID=A0A1U7M749_TISCR|nr:hypothetical protein TICRE_07350 [Tissierella creatinophila DSM 6911]
MVITKLINIIQSILLILIIFTITFFVFIKNTLVNPKTTDIRIISTLILLFIITWIIKFLLRNTKK